MTDQRYGSEMMTYGGSFVHKTTLPILLLVESDLLI